MDISSLVEIKANPNIPTFAPGDTVKVSTRVVEGEKERIQIFQGVVIKKRNSGSGSNFTVRRVTYGVGVERTFPLYSPRVEKVEVVRHGKVRRAKLNYLRGRSTKAARIKERRLTPQQLEREQAAARQLKQELEEAQGPELSPATEVAPEETPGLEVERELAETPTPEQEPEKN